MGWLCARAYDAEGVRGGQGTTVKADVKLANQILPGIISVRAAKHPAAKRETMTTTMSTSSSTSNAYNGR